MRQYGRKKVVYGKGRGEAAKQGIQRTEDCLGKEKDIMLEER